MNNKKRLKKSVKIILTSVCMGVIAAGTTVFLLAKSSSSSVKVENFVGYTKSQMNAWIEENGIADDRVTYSYEYDEEREKDIVIAQSLKEGESLSEDNTLDITLSNGADPDKEFTMSDFTGKYEDEIKAWFEENKFQNVTYTYEYHEDQEDKLFISSQPAAGTTVKRKDTVKIVISVKEPQTITVPDLMSYSKENIDAWAETNQITINYEEQYSDTVESGKVISVSVEAGTTITQGDSIDIVISKGTEASETAAQTQTKSYATNTTDYTGSVSGGESTGETTVSSGGVVDYDQTSAQTQANATVNGSPSTNSNTGTSTDTNTTTNTDSGTTTDTTVQCSELATFLYNGKSGSEIASSVQSAYPGSTVNINYLDNSENNPNSISGGIESYTLSGSTYTINVYQSWK